MKTADADAMMQQLKGLGDVMQLIVLDNPDTNNVTTSTRGFSVTLRVMGEEWSVTATNVE